MCQFVCVRVMCVWVCACDYECGFRVLSISLSLSCSLLPLLFFVCAVLSSVLRIYIYSINTNTYTHTHNMHAHNTTRLTKPTIVIHNHPVYRFFVCLCCRARSKCRVVAVGRIVERLALLRARTRLASPAAGSSPQLPGPHFSVHQHTCDAAAVARTNRQALSLSLILH